MTEVDQTENTALPAADQTRAEEKQARKKAHRREYVQAFLFTVVVALLLKAFFIEAFRIPSGSMEETLLEGDFLLVNKFIYGIRTPRAIPLTTITIPAVTLFPIVEPKMGDVLIFDFPGGRDEINPPRAETYIKRCIGTPGDTIEIINKTVHRNGLIVTNPPTMKFQSFEIRPRGQPNLKIFPPGSGFNEDNWGPVVVPKKGMIIPMTFDTRDWWYVFIKREGHTVEFRDSVYIDGRCAESYTVERDYLFVMGDNRDNSLDSRFWGFVPVDHVVGKAMFVYWSVDQRGTTGNITEILSSLRWNRVGTIIK